MYYVYILRCEDDTLYTGITTDVKRRFTEHREDKVKGANIQRHTNPKKLRRRGKWEQNPMLQSLNIALKSLAEQKKRSLFQIKRIYRKSAEYK